MQDSIAFSARPGEDGLHVTYCRICEALCGMVAEVRDGRIVKILPDRANPHSRGHICVKGPALAEVAYDKDRVTTPLKRVGGPGEFQPVGWDEALDEIAERLDASIERHGQDSFAMNTGNPPSLGWPSAIANARFQRAMSCKRHYTPGTEDIASVVLATELLFGTHAFVFPDLAECDHLLIFGSNPLVSHGSLLIAPRFKEDLDAIASRGRVIVIDPRRTETARKYEHVAVMPDGDVWLLAAMLRTLVEESLCEENFIREHCSGWTELADSLAWITPETAEPLCGVPAETIRSLAQDFARTTRAAAMGRIGICRGSFATLTNVLLHALNVVTGHFHREGGVGWGHGGSATDQQARPITGHMAYNALPSRVSGVPSVWGSQSSLTLYEEMVTPGEGQIKSLMVVGANPVMSMPNGPRLPEAFAQLDLMVALDLYVTETTRHAHFVLPVTTALEREDVNLFFMNHMVRPFAQHVSAVIEPVGQARMEFDILRDLAERLRCAESMGNFDPFAMADAALRGGVEGRSGMSLDLLRQQRHGMMIESGRWAFDLHRRIGHEDGRIHLWSEPIAREIARLRDAPPREADALRLVNQRKLRSINSWMHNVDKLVRNEEPLVLMHPADAARRDIADGARVALTTRWGSIESRVALTEDVREGSVAYPHGWGHQGGWSRANGQPGANLNSITPATPDMAEPISGMSYLEGFDVEVACV